MNAPDPEKLERLVHETLRALPHRRAPHSLESRVITAIATRAALPWWRHSYRQWPIAAKIAFVFSGAGAAALLIVIAHFIQGGFASAVFPNAFITPLAWLVQIRAIFSGLVDVFSTMFHAIPSLWFYSGLMVIASLYTALFGLGAAAYRALYLHR